MANIVLKCPNTKKWVPTGFGAASQAQFQSTSYVNCSFNCSACGKMHSWSSGDPDVQLDSGNPFQR